MNLLDEVLMLVVDRDPAKLRDSRSGLRRAGTVHLQSSESSQLQKSRTYSACRTVNQHALPAFDVRCPMQHLICGDVIEYEAHRLGGVQFARHRDQLTLWQADELGVTASDWQRRDCLAGLDRRCSIAESVDDANEIPTGCERKRWCFGMDSLTHHHVRQANAGSQDLYPCFVALRLGALFFNDPKFFGPAVVCNGDAFVFHAMLVTVAPMLKSRRLPKYQEFLVRE